MKKYSGTRSAVIDTLRRRPRQRSTRWSLQRHIPPGSGLPHLATIMANCAILIDAQAAGALDDDRATTAGFEDALKAVIRLKKE